MPPDRGRAPRQALAAFPWAFPGPKALGPRAGSFSQAFPRGLGPSGLGPKVLSGPFFPGPSPRSQAFSQAPRLLGFYSSVLGFIVFS